MKALIRNEGETVTQDMGFTFIDWNTGTPLTNRDWCGGPYTLAEDYREPADGEAVKGTGHDSARESQPIQSTPVGEKPAEQGAEPLPETVSYGGKEYTLDELKKLIG